MSKRLVAYFSATGTTRNAARLVAEPADADLYEIRPRVPYTPADPNSSLAVSVSADTILREGTALNGGPGVPDLAAGVQTLGV